MLWKWFVNIMFGWFVHSVGNGTIEKLGKGLQPTGAAWRRLSRYTIGYVACFFSFWYMLPEKHKTPEVSASYFMAAVGFGGGVAVGYIVDGVFEKEKALLWGKALDKLFSFSVKVDG